MRIAFFVNSVETETVGFTTTALALAAVMRGHSVVYVAPGKMPEGRVQYCEHLTPQHLWKPEYVNPLRLEEIYIVADDPVETAARWARFSGLLPRPEGETVALETARGKVVVGTREVLLQLLGDAPPGPGIAGYRLGCASAGHMAEHCARAGATVNEKERAFAVTLPPALGGMLLLG